MTTTKDAAVDEVTPSPGAARGIDYLHAMAAHEVPVFPFGQLTRMAAAHAEPGRVVFTCAPDESTDNAIGSVHGGLLCTLLDTVASAAVWSTLPAGKAVVSVEIKVNYLRAVLPGSGLLTATGTVVKAGSRIGVAEATVTTADGTAVATASSTLLVVDAAGAQRDSR